MLTAYQKSKIMAFVEKQVIDEEKLDTFEEDFNGECDWDYDEEMQVKGEQAIECIKADGLWEYTNLPDELGEEAIEFIDDKTSNYFGNIGVEE